MIKYVILPFGKAVDQARESERRARNQAQKWQVMMMMLISNADEAWALSIH